MCEPSPTGRQFIKTFAGGIQEEHHNAASGPCHGCGWSGFMNTTPVRKSNLGTRMSPLRKKRAALIKAGPNLTDTRRPIITWLFIAWAAM